jgi:hypothetical protein
MMPPRLLALLTIIALTVSDRLRDLRDSRDRGSDTTEKVMWIALLVTLVLAVYGAFSSKILSKINGITL